tara:strand:- start:152 stop:880 length:729 start_codon:yes stop_codon:yes gene_type:complete
MLKKFLLIFMAACFVPQDAGSSDNIEGVSEAIASPEYNSGLKIEMTALSHLERRTRQASVKVLDMSEMGHGSGAYIRYKGENLVFTAAHVVDSADKFYIVDVNGNRVEATVIYADNDIDFAILKPDQDLQVRPVRFKMRRNLNNNLIGTEVIFSGHPGPHSLMTIKGSVAGFERGAIMVHGYAWLGSSGSCVFDGSGNFIGVLRALDVGRFAVPQLTEDMIWVSPFSSIDWNSVDGSIENTN